jgi:hypothetical protein
MLGGPVRRLAIAFLLGTAFCRSDEPLKLPLDTLVDSRRELRAKTIRYGTRKSGLAIQRLPAKRLSTLGQGVVDPCEGVDECLAGINTTPCHTLEFSQAGKLDRTCPLADANPPRPPYSDSHRTRLLTDDSQAPGRDHVAEPQTSHCYQALRPPNVTNEPRALAT